MKEMVSHRLIDLMWQKFGMLRVVGRVIKQKSSATYWVCKCDCGRKKTVNGAYLKSGKTTNCGCVKGQELKFKKHGMAETSEYSTWCNMINRCYNEKTTSFKYYGALGVAVCEKWRKSFKSFIKDMGKKPSPEHSIDRYPNTKGNYEPGNCRWATRKEQNQNKRKSIWLDIPGRGRVSLKEVAELSGIVYGTLVTRYRKKPNNLEYILSDTDALLGRKLRIKEGAVKLLD